MTKRPSGSSAKNFRVSFCFKLCLMSSKRNNFFPTWFNYKPTKSSRNSNSGPPAQQSGAFPGGLFIFEGPSRSNCPIIIVTIINNSYIQRR